MFKQYKVFCNNCQWSGMREKPDLYVPCPICESEKDIVTQEDIINLEEETVFPEFEPSIEHNPPKTISLEEVMAKDALDNMKITIGRIGKTAVWNMIEKLVGNNKFSQMEIYLEAIKQLDEKNLGDNFPNIGDE